MQLTSHLDHLEECGAVGFVDEAIVEDAIHFVHPQARDLRGSLLTLGNAIGAEQENTLKTSTHVENARVRWVTMYTHLYDAREVAQVEQVVRLGRCWKEVGDRLLEDVERRTDDDLQPRK